MANPWEMDWGDADAPAAAAASAPWEMDWGDAAESTSKVKDYALTTASMAGQGTMGMVAGIADTLSAPVAKTRSMLAGGAALVDRMLPGQPNQTLQEFAQDEAAAAEAKSEQNALSNPAARSMAALRDGARDRVSRLKDFDREFNPELVRQQQAMGEAEGVVGTLRAIKDNPMAFYGNLAQSAPMMAAGVGVGSATARGLGVAGKALGMADDAVAAMALRGAGAAGVLSEAQMSGGMAREGVRASILETPHQQLSQGSPRYNELLRQGVAPDAAREALANEVATSASIPASMATAFGSVLTNKLMGDTTAKIMAGQAITAREAGKNVFKETLEETVQGLGEDYAQHRAMLEADTAHKFDPGGSAVQNAAAGFGMAAPGSVGGYGMQRFNVARGHNPDGTKPAVDVGKGKDSKPNGTNAQATASHSGSGATPGAAQNQPQGADAASHHGEAAAGVAATGAGVPAAPVAAAGVAFDYAAYPAYRRALESGGRADARNPNSTAYGADQFTRGTWLDMVARAKPAWAEGMSEAELLEQRANPERSAEMAAVLDQQNAAALRRAGQPVNQHTLYAAHHFGAGKAVAFSRASGDTLMDDILTPAQIKANAYLKGKTKDQAIANWDSRAGQAGVGAPAVAPAQPGPVAHVQQPVQRDTDEPAGLDLASGTDEAQQTLTQARELTDLDRATRLDREAEEARGRLAALSDPQYGETFDGERSDLRQRLADLEAEAAAIRQHWPAFQPGRPASFTTETGARLQGRYALVDASQLVTSHDESLRQNPAYPQALQPRARDRAASEVQISGIVGRLDPARLGLSADAATGAPIVGADGLVESGNARTIALKRVYQAQGQKAEDYRAFLEQNAGEFGLDPAQVRGLEQPVLVRLRDTPVDRAEFARQANASTVAAMSPSEQAKADAERIDMMDDLTPDDSGDFMGASNRGFVRRFMSRLPATEQAAMVDASGMLSTAGYARVRNAVLAKAYGDSPVLQRMTEALDDNSRNLTRALMMAAPEVAKMRAAMEAGARHDVDIVADLVAAVEELARLKDDGVSVREALAQAGMFGDKYSPETREFMEFMADNARRPRRIAELIKAYYQALDEVGDPSQGSLLGDAEAPTKGELLQAARRTTTTEGEDHAGHRSDQQEPAARGRAESAVAGQPDRGQREAAPGREGRDQDHQDAAGDAGPVAAEAPAKRRATRRAPAAEASEWVGFLPETGTLGIPRADMPQIKADDRSAFLQFLQARGMAYEKGEAQASELKPTQAEYSSKKLADFIDGGGVRGERSVIVSSDGYVLDGHHQWLGQSRMGQSIPVIRVDAPIRDLLAAANEFPSARRSEGATTAAPANFTPPKPDAFLPAEALRRADNLVAAHSKKAKPKAIPEAEYAKAEDALAPMIRAAEQEKAAFDQAITEVAGEHGIGQLLAPIKSLVRAAEKVALEYKGDASQIKDLLRATVVVRDYGDAGAVVNALAQRFELVEIKNKTGSALDGAGAELDAITKSQRRADFDGYADVSVTLRTEGGVTGEVQINVPEMLAAKEIGHQLYEVQRVHPKGSSAARHLGAGMTAIYDAAFAAAGNTGARTYLALADRKNDSWEISRQSSGHQVVGVRPAAGLRSSKKNRLPSGNSTYERSTPSPSARSMPKTQPDGNLSGTFISSPDASIVGERGEKGDRTSAVQQQPEAALEAYSEADLRQREAEREKAEAAEQRQRQDAERKVQADAQRNDFTLTGSDRAVDVAEAHGQQALLSRRSPDMPRNLVALHNLTADNLLAADRLGGIAVPSIGVTGVDAPFDGFGDITLIGPKSMVDPEAGVPVFDRDAYTARFPEMNYKRPKAKAADALYARMREAVGGDDLGGDAKAFLSELWESLRNDRFPNPGKVAHLFERYRAPRLQYLRDVMGKTIRAPMRDQYVRYPFSKDKALNKFIRGNEAALLGRSDISREDHDAAIADLADEVRQALDRFEAQTPDLADLVNDFRRRMFDADGLLVSRALDSLIADAKVANVRVPDEMKFADAISKALPQDDAGYKRWVRDQVEPLFDAPTITLRGKQVAPTLDNIVAAMTLKGVAGAEKTMTSGVGKTAAMLGKRFKSIAQIQAARDQVVSSEQEEAAKKSVEAMLNAYRDAVLPFSRLKNYRGEVDTWAAMDASMEALATAGKAGASDAAIRNALRRHDFLDVDQQVVGLARDAIDALRSSPTNYFEAKPQRAVGLSEFRGAVVPKNLPADARAALERAGVTLLEYNPRTEGARAKAIATLTKRLDRPVKDILFSRGEATRVAYESRIDELFVGKKARLEGVRVLDRSDVLALLGAGSGPVRLAEGKVNSAKHPNMTAEVWKKIPEWLDNPAAVFDSDTVNGRLVFVAPESVNGAPVLLVVQPDGQSTGRGVSVHLLVNAYDKDGGAPPFGRWLKDGKGRYVNQKEFPAILRASGLQLSGTAWQNKPGTPRILTEKHLAGWRKANDASLARSDVADSQRGVAATDLQAMAARVQSALPNLPDVDVLQSTRQAPPALREYLERQGAMDDAEGALFDGRIYLFADNLQSMERAEHVLATHEAGHAGLAGLLGADKGRVLQALANQNDGLRMEAARLAKRLDVPMATAIEEVLVDTAPADLAKLKGWHRVVHRIQRWLQRSGFHALARRMNQWIHGRLDDRQRADLLAADLMAAAHDWLAGRGMPAGEAAAVGAVPVLLARAASDGENFAGQRVAGRDTNAGVANSQDVAGNKSGRPAGDNTRAAAALAAAREAVSIVHGLAQKHGVVYVRWAANAQHDLSPGARSKDHQTGQFHAGLSAVAIDSSMTPARVASALLEYGYHRLTEPDSKPRVYLAKRVGEDSDGYDSIRPERLLWEPDETVLRTLDKAQNLFIAEERLADATDRLTRITDPIGIRLVRQSIEEHTREAEAARRAILDAAGNEERRAASADTGRDYRTKHRPAGPEFGARLDDLTGVFSSDIYGRDAVRLHGHLIPADGAAVSTIQKVRGNPDATVTIYRAVPKDAGDAINAGDWVTLTREYARDHGDGPLDGDYKIISAKVPAGTLFNEGNSIHEFGYNPPTAQNESSAPAGSGAGLGDPRLSRSSARPPASAAPQSPAAKKTAAERAQAIIDRPANRTRPLEAFFQALTRYSGVEIATRTAGALAGRALDRLTPEAVKAGIVADYGLPEDAINERVLMQGRKLVELRRTGSLVEKMAVMSKRESEIAYDWMTSKDPVAIMRGLSSLPEGQIEVLQEVQQLIDRLSRDAVDLGLLSQSAYERNKGAYLHRSYQKHVLAEQEGKRGRGRGGGGTTAVLGANLRRRGIDATARMDQLRQTAPEWWDVARKAGKADPDLIGRKVIKMERRAPSGEGTQSLPGMEGRSPGRVLETRYLPAERAIPREYADWTNAGEWEIRDVTGDALNLWRDYTPEERQRMGEIKDVRYAVMTTLQGMIQDVETARYLRWVSRTYAKPEGAEVDGDVVDASEGYLRPFKPGEWVKVPDSTAPGTKAKRYGELAGKYVPGPIWNDIRHQMRSGKVFEGKLGEGWDTVMRAWKTSKTALSPTVHVNNIMSNFVMADWADVSMTHVAKAMGIIMGTHDRQGEGFIGGAGNKAARAIGIEDREAAQAIVTRYKDSGGELGGWVVNETVRSQLEPMLTKLQADLASDPENIGAQAGVSAALQNLLHGQFSDAARAAMGSKAAMMTAREAKNVIDLYGNEDSVFRLAAWLKAKEDGASDIEAGKIARRAFMDYNINAPWVQLAKNTALPFVSFSYRGVPLLAEVMTKKPHKIIKLMSIAGALNHLGLLMAGGADDDKVRRLMPDEKAGGLWGMVPKLIRMPWNDRNASPVYLDIRRWVPMGDIVDVGQGHAALPIPPSLMPGGPLAIMGELWANKSAFTGKPITLETDTAAERATKVVDHLYKAFAPNVLGLPGTYASTNVINAAKGKTDPFGREQSVPMAVAGSFGFKLGAYPADVLRRNAVLGANAQTAEIDRGIRAIQRQVMLKSMSHDEGHKKIQRQLQKKEEVMRKMQERLGE